MVLRSMCLRRVVPALTRVRLVSAGELVSKDSCTYKTTTRHYKEVKVDPHMAAESNAHTHARRTAQRFRCRINTR
jgi:hypothetical protein